MDDLRRTINNAQNLHTNIGADLDAMGGVHRCKVCGYELPMQPGDAAYYLRHGWPRHCEQGMRWVTARELAQEAESESEE